MARVRSAVALILILVPAIAWSAPPAAPIFPDLRFNAVPPERLALGRIEIVDGDPTPYAPPRVEQEFPIPPAHAIENWVRDRLAAAGGSDRLRVTIERGRVNEIQLPPTPGYSDPQSQRYDADVRIRLDILDDRGVALATVSVNATRSQGVLQSTSVDERALIWYDMTRELMAAIDGQLDREIRAHFAAYLR